MTTGTTALWSPPPLDFGVTPKNPVLQTSKVDSSRDFGVTPKSPVPQRADVVIVGGGFTGLWTAYYLLRTRPDLQVVVLEAEHVGFGASGRNGGWASALWPVSPDRIAAAHGRSAALAMLAELRHTVDEVGEVCRHEGIDAGFHKGGTLVVARGPAQEARARAYAGHGASWENDTIWLGPEQTFERLPGAGPLNGATFTPHCARIHPRRLVDGLAEAVVRLGGIVIEGARVQDIQPGTVTTNSGDTIRAQSIVRATEAWAPRLPSSRRAIAPVYSLMVATEPLADEHWSRIGLADNEVFSDHGHVIIYGQRTVDGRIAFGGRGAPYHYASDIKASYDHEEQVFSRLREELHRLLPALGDVRFTHAWGGPLGIARDWHPSVGYDPSNGLGWAGGYVGDGVAATNLAGRTLVALITGKDDPITVLPWVGHRSPSWEPEPMRWLGVNAGLRLAEWADAEERRSRRPARIGPLVDRFTGH